MGKILVLDFFSNFYIFHWRVLWVDHEWSSFADYINNDREMV